MGHFSSVRVCVRVCVCVCARLRGCLRAKRRVADDVSEARILGKFLKQSFAVTWDC